ncbi:MAG: quinolinate synthase NadA [Desulfobacterales bacterium]|nr:quinolinate synthase NadA [Desulfobacterales bacterium]
MPSIIDQIRTLRQQRNAIILAHNYVLPEVQDIADMCGDSLELSRRASETNADVIVFCGVRFMAETASILSPDKKVLLPVLDAGCPMADMVTPEQLKQKMQMLPNIPVVTYVNSNADVKALSTVCCTSANVVDIVNQMESDEILMVPDKNLARYAARFTQKKIHLWDGYCPIHHQLTSDQVIQAKKAYPKAEFIAHPECSSDVLDMADAILSTSGMIAHTTRSSHYEFIIATEMGMLYPLQKANPQKQFYSASPSLICPDMKKIHLADILNCLSLLSNEIKVPEEIRVLAYNSVERMIRMK